MRRSPPDTSSPALADVLGVLWSALAGAAPFGEHGYGHTIYEWIPSGTFTVDAYPGRTFHGELESFSAELDGGLEYPHYTRPAEFHGWPVPEVLLSGDHAKIRRWRRAR